MALGEGEDLGDGWETEEEEEGEGGEEGEGERKDKKQGVGEGRKDGGELGQEIGITMADRKEGGTVLEAEAT